MASTTSTTPAAPTFFDLVDGALPAPKAARRRPAPKPVPHFDGATYAPEHDGARLRTLLGRVWSLMADGGWYTLAEVQAQTGGSEAAVSARLRDFRKPDFGAHTVDRRRRGNPASGLYEYRLTPNPRHPALLLPTRRQEAA